MHQRRSGTNTDRFDLESLLFGDLDKPKGTLLGSDKLFTAGSKVGRIVAVPFVGEDPFEMDMRGFLDRIEEI